METLLWKFTLFTLMWCSLQCGAEFYIQLNQKERNNLMDVEANPLGSPRLYNPKIIPDGTLRFSFLLRLPLKIKTKDLF
uniref:Uncharacterized protein n=1 Tax=Lepeophtheirus salmonis TaxID=72036 RepID=A0A0K2T004_LEPSM